MQASDSIGLLSENCLLRNRMKGRHRHLLPSHLWFVSVESLNDLLLPRKLSQKLASTSLLYIVQTAVVATYSI